MAVKGNLKDISLTNLIQVNAQSGFSGRISLTSANEKAALYFAEGDIIHVFAGEEKGEEAFNRILGWDEADFELETGLVAPDKTIQTSWSDLLLRGMQYLDEKNLTNSTSEGEIPSGMGELFGFEKSSLEEGATHSEDNVTKKMQDILTDLGEEATGLFAAAVVGMDGLPLADYSRQEVDTDSFSAQLTLLIKLVDTTTKKIDAGKVEDYLLTTDNAYLLVRFLDDSDYYLGIGAARKSSSLGKLRLFSRIYAERLSKALPR